MSTYTRLLFQIVFSTKKRKPCLTDQNRDDLHRYIWGILKNKKCYLHRVNSVEDHIHILLNMPPTMTVCDLVKDIKIASNKMIKEKNLFPDFDGWQSGYSAFTYSFQDCNRLIQYVKNQKQHHKNRSFLNELIILYKEHEIDYQENYLV